MQNGMRPQEAPRARGADLYVSAGRSQRSQAAFLPFGAWGQAPPNRDLDPASPWPEPIALSSFSAADEERPAVIHDRFMPALTFFGTMALVSFAAGWFSQALLGAF